MELALRQLWSLKLTYKISKLKKLTVNCECCTEYDHAMCKWLDQDHLLTCSNRWDCPSLDT